MAEAPAFIRRPDALYMFYAGNICCGRGGPRGCRYAVGVARAPSILGPWRRNPRNPIVRTNRAWICPGHGTPVETSVGQTWLLYHAYRRGGDQPLVRQMVLDRVDWGTDGWPVVNGGAGPSRRGPLPIP